MQPRVAAQAIAIQVVSRAGVRPVDTYGILKAFGRDCAGAIMLLPDGERPAGNERSGYSPMTLGDLQRVISTLDIAPLGAAPERGFRPSLADFQRKALLGRGADGTWQLPYGDAPSTWILKPDGPHAMAANEATCLALAAACDLAVPEAELLDVAGLPVLAVRRYDRQDSAAGHMPVRVHQEDGCQATATPPGLRACLKTSCRLSQGGRCWCWRRWCRGLAAGQARGHDVDHGPVQVGLVVFG